MPTLFNNQGSFQEEVSRLTRRLPRKIQDGLIGLSDWIRQLDGLEPVI